MAQSSGLTFSNTQPTYKSLGATPLNAKSLALSNMANPPILGPIKPQVSNITTPVKTPVSNNFNLNQPGLTQMASVPKIDGTKPIVPTGQNSMQNNTPVDPNIAQKTAIQGQIGNLQNQISGAQNAGYSGDQQIQTDAQGNVIPKAQVDAQNLYKGQAQNLANIATNGTPQVQAAIEAQKQFQLNQAQQNANIASNPNFSADTAAGREAILGQRYASALPAYQQAVTAATTQQGQQINAAGQAAGLAQPQVTSQGMTSFSPYAGQFTGQNSQTNTIESLAQDVANNRKTPAQAEALLAGGAVVNAQLDAAIKKINPSYNRAVSESQTNTLAGIVPMETANTAAKGIKNTINNFIDANPQLNQVDAAVVNSAQQWLQGKQLADPKYQTLFNYLNEYTSTLTPILGVGGSSTNLKTEIAQSFVNAQAKGSSIKEVLNNIESLADNKIANLKSGAVGGGVVSGGNTNSGGNNGGSGFGWNPSA